jgi:hypothetical protein
MHEIPVGYFSNIIAIEHDSVEKSAITPLPY